MSAHIRFLCPTCKAIMDAPVQRAGNKINCLKCGQRVQIPSAERAKTVLAPALGVHYDPDDFPPAGTSPTVTQGSSGVVQPVPVQSQIPPSPPPSSVNGARRRLPPVVDSLAITVGVLFIVVGLASGLWAFARVTSLVGQFHTWAPPFSQYERVTIFIILAAVASFAIGLVVGIYGVVSSLKRPR